MIPGHANLNHAFVPEFHLCYLSCLLFASCTCKIWKIFFPPFIFLATSCIFKCCCSGSSWSDPILIINILLESVGLEDVFQTCGSTVPLVLGLGCVGYFTAVELMGWKAWLVFPTALAT